MTEAADQIPQDLAGARRGRRVRTTIPGNRVRAGDLVGRRFDPPAPDRLWVADFTYVPTWSGWSTSRS